METNNKILMNWDPETNHFRDIWPCFCGIILSTSYEITRKEKKFLSDNVNVVKKEEIQMPDSLEIVYSQAQLSHIGVFSG